MAAEQSQSGGEVFLDTSLLVAATVDLHPAHQSSISYVEKVLSAGLELCISGQVCREFLVVLTRQIAPGVKCRQQAKQAHRVLARSSRRWLLERE